MPSRSDFLSTGLAPVVIPIHAEEECSVCRCTYTDPVKLPCGHVFDRLCIETWLKMRCRNTCPMCKAKLFDLPLDENPRVGEDRRQQVAAALRSSRLGERDATSTVENFGCRPLIASDLQRATANACNYLGQEPVERQSVSGPAVISTGKMLANLVAMANLIPNLAAAQGHPYTDQERKDWKLVLIRLTFILKSQEGKKCDALVLPAKLRKDVKTDLSARYSDVDCIAFFFTFSDPSYLNPCYDDLDLLLRYLAFRCWTVQKELDAVIVARKEVKVKTSKPHNGPRMKHSCSVM